VLRTGGTRSTCSEYRLPPTTNTANGTDQSHAVLGYATGFLRFPGGTTGGQLDAERFQWKETWSDRGPLGTDPWGYRSPMAWPSRIPRVERGLRANASCVYAGYSLDTRSQTRTDLSLRPGRALRSSTLRVASTIWVKTYQDGHPRLSLEWWRSATRRLRQSGVRGSFVSS